MNDALTGIYNRATFFERLNAMVRETLEYNAPLGLLLIDVNRFNSINSNYGYLSGDLVLQGVAGVLKNVCRKGDVIARIADDQFALIISRVANKGHAELAAHKIQRLLDVPIQAEKRMIRCNTTIGIGLFPAQAHSADTLLLITSRALNMAKRLDQPIGYIEEEEAELLSEHWDIEIALPDSISNAELEVYFQPKIALATGLPIGAEALVRWNHPGRGLISPGEFLPIAESIGFLKPLSIWVLNSALRYSSSWTDKWGQLGVSVNIPPTMMAQPDFVDLIISAENLWEKNNSHLCLEVLEESLIEDMQQVFKSLEELRTHGVQISIDDFGTGYSSLSYFKDIPADELKIDQSFVRTLASDEANRNIVNLIIEMSRLFGLKVVAEGVEDEKTLSYLKSKGCDYVQGYYLARPMPAAAFQKWLEDYTPLQG
jgi:diguanylate cyclase (GGDEF)-like protein